MRYKIAHSMTKQYYFMNGKYKHIAEKERKDSETILKEGRENKDKLISKQQ